MPQKFSEETQELLSRAQRAIDRSTELRDAHSCLVRASQELLWDLEASLARWRASDDVR